MHGELVAPQSGAHGYKYPTLTKLVVSLSDKTGQTGFQTN
jgi:hypothetical protein